MEDDACYNSKNGGMHMLVKKYEIVFSFIVTFVVLAGIGLWNRQVFHFLSEISIVMIGLLGYVIALSSKLYDEDSYITTLAIVLFFASLLSIFNVFGMSSVTFITISPETILSMDLFARASIFLIIFLVLMRSSNIKFTNGSRHLFVIIMMSLLALILVVLKDLVLEYSFTLNMIVFIVFLILIYKTKRSLKRENTAFIVMSMMLLTVYPFFLKEHDLVEMLLYHYLKISAYMFLYLMIITNTITRPLHEVRRFYEEKLEEYIIDKEIDNTTGVYTRDMAIKLIRQNILEKEFYLIMLDVDNFKNVNDTYGHLVGDTVLREVGKLLQHPSSTVGRYGGDEFIIGVDLNESDMKQYIENVMERAKRQLSKYSISLSAGVTKLRDSGEEDFQNSIYDADMLLYEVKRNGKNGYLIR